MLKTASFVDRGLRLFCQYPEQPVLLGISTGLQLRHGGHRLPPVAGSLPLFLVYTARGQQVRRFPRNQGDASERNLRRASPQECRSRSQHVPAIRGEPQLPKSGCDSRYLGWKLEGLGYRIGLREDSVRCQQYVHHRLLSTLLISDLATSCSRAFCTASDR